MNYKHMQIGWVIIVSMIVAIIFTFFLEGAWPLAVILAGVLILFATLTVSVDADNVLISFGPGLIRKKFPLKDIESCQVAKGRCCSWGIHGWGKKWLFNVSGFSSVELKMKNGMMYYIGTDQPAELEKAIKECIIKSRS